MLLKSSLTNQKAVQAKSRKKSSRASGQEEEKKLQCVSVCSFCPSPEQIFINLGTPVLGYIWMGVCVCVYVEEFTGGQSKGVSTGLC